MDVQKIELDMEWNGIYKMDVISGSRKQHLALDNGFRTTANNDDIDKCNRCECSDDNNKNDDINCEQRCVGSK